MQPFGDAFDRGPLTIPTVLQARFYLKSEKQSREIPTGKPKRAMTSEFMQGQARPCPGLLPSVRKTNKPFQMTC